MARNYVRKLEHTHKHGGKLAAFIQRVRELEGPFTYHSFCDIAYPGAALRGHTSIQKCAEVHANCHLGGQNDGQSDGHRGRCKRGNSITSYLRLLRVRGYIRVHDAGKRGRYATPQSYVAVDPRPVGG